MSNLRENLISILSYAYGIGIFISFFAGALSLIGYIAAFIVGGDIAAVICKFIYKDFYPVIIYISSVSVLLGLVKMYVAGEKALTPDTASKKK